MKNRTRMFGSILLASALAAGCSSVVKQPEVTLTSIEVGGIGLRGATLIAHLDVGNPNSFDIETDSIVYELEAASPSDATSWSRITQGTVTQRIKIDDNNKTKVEIPIEFGYSGLGGAMRSILDRGTFNYRVRGTVFIREPLKRSVPFTKSGNLSLAGAR